MEMMGRAGSEQTKCRQCDGSLAVNDRFCHHCGAFQRFADIDDAVYKERLLGTLAVFFGIHLLVCLISNFTRYGHGLVPLLIFDAVLSLLTIAYTLLMRKDLLPVLRWPGFSLVKTAGYAALSILFAVLTNYAVKWLNKTIFDSESYYYYAFSHLKYAKLVTIMVVALQPAIFEELAFRGVLQGGLNKIFDQRQAILISAFLFALLHMSFISFFWLLPFALWLGYTRMKEQTIWYGVIIHFCFNATACFLEFFELHLI